MKCFYLVSYVKMHVKMHDAFVFFSAELKKLGHIITSDFIYIILEVVHSGFHVVIHLSYIPSLT